MEVIQSALSQQKVYCCTDKSLMFFNGGTCHNTVYNFRPVRMSRMTPVHCWNWNKKISPNDNIFFSVWSCGWPSTVYVHNLPGKDKDETRMHCGTTRQHTPAMPVTVAMFALYICTKTGIFHKTFANFHPMSQRAKLSLLDKLVPNIKYK